MEFEVRVVGGMESCFVSLPLSLIQTLQSTHLGLLPPILALELRSRRSSDDCWHLAWSGSASKSSAIEVAQQLAECISLPDRSEVQVRAIANLPKAILVTIEPSTEDDWEILELNSELAEVAILKQVGIVHEGMRFPLWVHGHTVIVFSVVSTSPSKSVVQLVPGTEVAVAPKRRKKDVDSYQVAPKHTSVKEPPVPKALLRVQAQNKRLVHRIEVKGVELGIVLTSIAFIHSETAKNLLFDNLQLVIVFSRSTVNDNVQNQKNNTLRKMSNLSANERNLEGSTISKGAPRHAIVRLLLSDSVAKGHIMLPQSLRLYLRAGLHSWVHVKRYNITPKMNIPLLTLSPCRFKFGKDNPLENNRLDIPASRKALKSKSTFLRTDLVASADVIDWSFHEEVLASLSSGCPKYEGEEVMSKSVTTKGNECLITAWFIGQLEAIRSFTGGIDANSIVLGNETLFHIEVTGRKFGSITKEQTPSGDSLEKRNRAGEPPVELLFVLTAAFEESSYDVQHDCYELAAKAGNMCIDNLGGLELTLGKLNFGEPASFDSVKEKSSERSFSLTVSSLSWMETAISDVINRLTVLLSPNSGKCFSDFPFPGHVLIYGPPGSGKTSLAMAVAKYLEEHEEILAHIVFVSCSKLSMEKALTIRQSLAGYISEALDNSPSLLIFDDLDSVVSSSSEPERSQLSTSVTALVEFFKDIIDEYGEKRPSSCGIGPIALMASVKSLGDLPQSLSSSGRFDFHVQLPAPAVSERGAILKHEINKRSLKCSEDILSDIASKCDGYDAYDLEILVDRAVHAAVGRYLSCHDVLEECVKPILVKEDFLQAMHDFLPVAMRGITKSASEGGRAGWEDVGGLTDIRNAIQEVRDIFSKAASAAPCLLFFDEFDSIAPKRGHDNTGVTDRVVNQLLTELDGVEALTGVFVFAATSRPDLLDAALLRPGRLDRLLFCDFPSWRERVDILTVLSRELPLASDVDLEAIASITEGFSGADLQALLSDTQLASVHELLESGDVDKPGKKPVISDVLLKSVATKARPSVSEAEKQRLYVIYNQFLDSKKSVAAQARDVKGKRATLA
ncbi:peroxisomal ATPase PEX1 isoform X2 [Magnolia sinica]|uniref:peroxisomal ATPase PEX1 isoform X2 n=1 Tax=Magnolia sinica TaxID=86752 RepID=UPI002657E42E|nr:peroxisomal ATPase PEX1 isoform X2 [Magnolia sinica]